MKRIKPLIIAGIVIIVAVILVIAGTVIIERYIEKELRNLEVGDYKIQVRQSQASILKREIEVNDVVVENKTGGVTLKIPAVKVSGISILPMLFRDQLIVNRIIVEEPDVIILQQETDGDDESREAVPAEQETEIDFLMVKKLEIGSADFLIQNETDQKMDTVFSIQAGVDIWNFRINSDSERLTYNNHSAERFQMKLQQGLFNIPGDLYRLELGSVELDSDQAVMELKNLALKSLHPKFEIWKQTGAQTDWIDIVIPSIRFHGIDIQASISDTAVIFRKALLEEMNANVFRNKKPPFPEKPDTKLPMELIESLPIGIHADSILVQNSNVTYEELAEESSETGVVTFNQLYASIYNLSNMDSLITGQTGMAARARLMNNGLIEADFIFPNSQVPQPYRVTGKLTPTNIAEFNPILVPSAFVRVDEGQIKRLEFDFTYDTNSSDGKLELEYENLKITLLDKDDGSKKTFKTFIAETFILQKDNLREKRSYKEGSISFERDKKRFVFNYWWKSLFSGMQDIIGV